MTQMVLSENEGCSFPLAGVETSKPIKGKGTVFAERLLGEVPSQS